jgi:hypothetical protein
MELLRLSGWVDRDADATAEIESRLVGGRGSVGAEPPEHLKCSKDADPGVGSLVLSGEHFGERKLRFPLDSSQRGWDEGRDMDSCGYADFDV